MANTINLDKLNKDDLLALAKQVEGQLKVVETRRQKDAKAEAEKVAQKYGFSLSDLVGPSAKSPKTKRLDKYRHPDDPTQTWSGHGRRPKWFLKLTEEKGINADDLIIK